MVSERKILTFFVSLNIFQSANSLISNMDFYPKKNSGPFRCEVCDVTVNSEMQLVQHRTGKMHVRKMQADIPSEETGGWLK